MAKQTTLVSDQSGKPIENGKGAKMRISYDDQRLGVWELDLTNEEAKALSEKGRKISRRGRKPKAAAA